MGRSKSIQRYVKQVPDDTVIWRFLTPEKLLWFLRDEAIYFCQLQRFLDENEGDIQSFSKLIPEGSELHKTYILTKNAKLWRAYCGASCWHINDDISFDMWKEYSNCEGGAISTTVGKLKSNIGLETDFGHIEYGAVDYSGSLPVLKQGEALGLDIVMFYKLPTYSIEREFRALLYSSPKIMDLKGGINIRVHLPNLVNHIYLPDDQPQITRIVLENLIFKSSLTDKVRYIHNKR